MVVPYVLVVTVVSYVLVVPYYPKIRTMIGTIASEVANAEPTTIAAVLVARVADVLALIGLWVIMALLIARSAATAALYLVGVLVVGGMLVLSVEVVHVNG